MIRENIFSNTTAIALRTSPYSQTSSIITWLSPDRGRISTIVKGSFRPKSGFLGQHDLFYTCDLVYYEKDRNGLHVAREFFPLKTRSGIRENWRSAVMASYISCLISDTPQNDPHSSELYELADNTLDFLDKYQANVPLLLWFELKFLSAAGLTPHLASCSKCGTRLNPAKPVSFSVADGGLRCPDCAPGSSSTSQVLSSIQPDSIAALRLWQNSTSPRTANNTKCSPSQIGELAALLKSFLEFHVDFQHESRDIALRLLQNKSKRKT